jgi:hypothetical protein
MVYLRVTISPLGSDVHDITRLNSAEFIFRVGDGGSAARAAAALLRERGLRLVAIADVYENFTADGYSDSLRLRTLQAEAERQGCAFCLSEPDGSGAEPSRTATPFLRSA